MNNCMLNFSLRRKLINYSIERPMTKTKFLSEGHMHVKLHSPDSSQKLRINYPFIEKLDKSLAYWISLNVLVPSQGLSHMTIMWLPDETSHFAKECDGIYDHPHCKLIFCFGCLNASLNNWCRFVWQMLHLFTTHRASHMYIAHSHACVSTATRVHHSP